MGDVNFFPLEHLTSTLFLTRASITFSVEMRRFDAFTVRLKMTISRDGKIQMFLFEQRACDSHDSQSVTVRPYVGTNLFSQFLGPFQIFVSLPL